MNALLTGGMLFGYCKGYTTIKGVECPIDVQLQTAGVLAASKLVSDTALPDPVMRAASTGALFSGSMFLLFDDKNWFRWAALGTAASYISDVLLPPQQPRQMEDD